MNREKMMEYALKEKYRGIIEAPSGVGVFVDEQEGEKITVYINVHREVITEIYYDSGDKKICYPASASAEYMCEYLKEKPIMEAALFSYKKIDEFYGGLEKGSIHSAIMVEMALKRAINNYLQRKKMQ